MKRNFAFTIGAMKEVCERCPDHEIEKVFELFEEEDTLKRLDNMIWIICVLNKWAVFKETGAFDGALTESELLAMDFADLNDMFSEAITAFNADKQPETEIEPNGKKTEAVPKSKN